MILDREEQEEARAALPVDPGRGGKNPGNLSCLLSLPRMRAFCIFTRIVHMRGMYVCSK